MATTTSLPVRPGVVLRGIGWDGYLTLLDLIGDGHTRVTYDRGDAELMSPWPAHDRNSRLIGVLILLLDDTSRYREFARSLAFPWLDIAEAAGMIRAGAAKDLIAWQRDLNAWASDLYERPPAG